jgi:hypothetical protein
MKGYKVLRYIFLSFGRKWKPEILLTPTAQLPKEEEHKKHYRQELMGSPEPDLIALEKRKIIFL